ncbi:hypothetical protein R1flu_005330 [Riccia fluitans]|uniref:Uncharacterized protein n=1 Tax=Riccia fluitans TaxID=41844 RepID=A0ABD1YSV5_9MARC
MLYRIEKAFRTLLQTSVIMGRTAVHAPELMSTVGIQGRRESHSSGWRSEQYASCLSQERKFLVALVLHRTVPSSAAASATAEEAGPKGSSRGPRGSVVTRD